MPKQVIKTKITLVRVHDSDHMAQLEADQLNANADALSRLAPSPRTWRLKARVLKATARLTGSVRNKPSVEFDVEVEGAQVDIDGWVEEYKRVHTLMPTRAEEMQKLKDSSTLARRKASEKQKKAIAKQKKSTDDSKKA